MVGSEDGSSGVDVVAGVEISFPRAFHDGSGHNVDGILLRECLKCISYTMSSVEFGKVAKNRARDAVFWKDGNICTFFLGAGNSEFDSLEIFFDLKVKDAILDDGDGGIHRIIFSIFINFLRNFEDS